MGRGLCAPLSLKIYPVGAILTPFATFVKALFLTDLDPARPARVTRARGEQVHSMADVMIDDRLSRRGTREGNDWRWRLLRSQLPTREVHTSIHFPYQRLGRTHHPVFVSRSWTQAEFLCSGHYMPSTPEGAPLAQHASFLPPDDAFMLGADEPKECRRGRGFAKPAAKERATITSSEWHVFGGGVPLVRQHSQGATQTDAASQLGSSSI